MFRKVLLAALLVGVGFAYGYASHRLRVFPYELIRWSAGQARLLLGTPDGSDVAWVWVTPPTQRLGDDASEIRPEIREQLGALGYLQGYVKAPGETGLMTYVPNRAHQGLNLVLSGHGPEATLMSMEGEVVHRWRYPFERKWPDEYDPEDCCGQRSWRRARLLPEGELLAIFENKALIKIDSESNLIWSRLDGYHHDLSIAPDGRIYVLHSELKILPSIHPSLPAMDDAIEILSPDGERLERISILEAFENSSYAPYLKRVDERILSQNGDIFHTNALKLLDGGLEERSPVFRKGNVLISLRYLDLIAIVDPERRQVVWALSGMWLRQHEPVLLDNGNMLLFDNEGHHGMSKVIEFDPFTQRVAWSYEGTPANGFRSNCCGSNQRLPNGNTLVTDTTNGRAFELTPENEIVWEFVNPRRSEEAGELIAVLMDVIRIEQEDVAAWLTGN